VIFVTRLVDTCLLSAAVPREDCQLAGSFAPGFILALSAALRLGPLADEYKCSWKPYMPIGFAGAGSLTITVVLFVHVGDHLSNSLAPAESLNSLVCRRCPWNLGNSPSWRSSVRILGNGFVLPLDILFGISLHFIVCGTASARSRALSSWAIGRLLDICPLRIWSGSLCSHGADRPSHRLRWF